LKDPFALEIMAMIVGNPQDDRAKLAVLFTRLGSRMVEDICFKQSYSTALQHFPNSTYPPLSQQTRRVFGAMHVVKEENTP